MQPVSRTLHLAKLKLSIHWTTLHSSCPRPQALPTTIPPSVSMILCYSNILRGYYKGFLRPREEMFYCENSKGKSYHMRRERIFAKSCLWPTVYLLRSSLTKLCLLCAVFSPRKNFQQQDVSPRSPSVLEKCNALGGEGYRKNLRLRLGNIF